MKIQFIAHAGISIREGDTHILIDPWFTSSTVKYPVLESLVGHSTIDFQLPQGYANVEEYMPVDAVFVSHFHTHHAPKKDILDIFSKTTASSPLFGYPTLKKDNQDILDSLFREKGLDVRAQGFVDGESCTIGSLTIRAYTHTVSGHLAWHVFSKQGSLLHIADPAGNRNRQMLTLDAVWEKFNNLNVDVLFVNASGNSLQIKDAEGNRSISELSCLSPGQAALLAHRIQTKVVSLIGCYNKSVWNGLMEYVRPSAVVEEEFDWAMRFMNPEVKFVAARPGHTYVTRTEMLGDTHIG
ncbi:MBL fold metallo-hydrolase [Patescibacteria group bacterium]|nr:MBL fold metallo-hydrolase [Patescibacteria group bacterium]